MWLAVCVPAAIAYMDEKMVYLWIVTYDFLRDQLYIMGTPMLVLIINVFGWNSLTAVLHALCACVCLCV